jgi:small subunit ribosomal protein S17
MLQRKKGKIVGLIGDKTIKVAVERSIAHPLYRKRRIVSRRYLAHVEEGTFALGENVTIEATPRRSRLVAWKVVTTPKEQQ